jgi:hypothetical protein
MFRSTLAIVLSFWSAIPAVAAGLDAAAVNDAASPAKLTSSDGINASIAKMQILLDRAQFSPGEIDGKFGENAQKALAAFAEGGDRAQPRGLRRQDRQETRELAAIVAAANIKAE